MGSSSAGGADGRSRALVDDLMDVRERATMLLQTMLQGSPPTPTLSAASSRYASAAPEGTCSELIEKMMSRLSSALSTLDTTGGGGSSSGGQGQQGQQGRRRKKGAVAGSGPERRSSTTRRRSHSPFVETITASALDDGKSWRKYGQKRIQDSPNNPRSYYRCTHKPDQGCRATRQVQVSDANPSEFVISYYGQHTCRDPSTFPLVIQDTAPPPDCENLISFGSSTIVVASTSAHTTAVPPPQTARAFDPTMTFSRLVGGYSSSLPAQDYRCGSEEVHSSGSLAAVVGSVGMSGSSATVGSAPAEFWPGGAGACGGPGTGSFPSSPSSLGFMTGSFGSFGNAAGDDDDLFGFDP